MGPFDCGGVRSFYFELLPRCLYLGGIRSWSYRECFDGIC